MDVILPIIAFNNPINVQMPVESGMNRKAERNLESNIMKKPFLLLVLLAPLLSIGQTNPSSRTADMNSVQGSNSSTGSNARVLPPPPPPQPPPMDAIVLQPSNTNAVPEYSKFEMGLNYTSVSSKIDAFLNDATGNWKPGTSGYATAFNAGNGTIINPYDPQQMAVDVAFYRPSSPNSNPVIRHGFYYKVVGDNHTFNQPATDWTKQATVTYPWRIRFAPDELGTWMAYPVVYINNQVVQSSLGYQFTVVASSNPGFIQKGPNPSYLQYSGSGATYIPVGNNYAWALNKSTGGLNQCNSANCFDTQDARMNYTAIAELNNFVNLLTASPNGANTTRLLMAPWGFQIEMEKLGNYDSRQIEMSVLDDYISLLEQKNIKLVLGQGVVDFGNFATWQDPTKYAEGWNANPYNGSISSLHGPNSSQPYPNASFKGITGIATPQDLFNPYNIGYSTALQFYKNRWRYIDARWGYSTAISTYELLTEVDQMSDAGGNNIYWGKTPMEPNVSSWLNSITQYLKVDLATKHLTTVSYAGTADPFKINLPQQSQIFGSSNLDIVSGHIYGCREALARLNFKWMQDGKNAFPAKPVYFNESDDIFFDDTNLCTDMSMHNNTWASIFSGAMGPGLTWAQQRYAIQWNSGTGMLYSPAQPNGPVYGAPNTYANEYERNFPAFMTFINKIDFKTKTYNYYSYTSVPALTPPGPILRPFYEVFYMKNSPSQYIYGWAHNRSYTASNNTPCMNNTGNYNNMSNYRTAPANLYFAENAPQTTTANGGYFYNEDGYVDAFGTSFSPTSLGPNNIVIPNLTGYKYIVTWVWTWGSNGGQDYSQSAVFADSYGNLSITVPPTGYVGGTLYPGDWAFRIIPDNFAPRFGTGIEEKTAPKMLISPNPSSDVFYISAAEGSLHEKANIELFDISGKLLLNQAVPDVDHYPLDLREMKNGIYILKVTVSGQTSILKLVKTD
jgi:hypothetical protein